MEDRPLASLVLLAWNDEAFVAEALRGAFGQTYRPLQIVVSEDAGSDGTWAIVGQLAGECPPDIDLVLRRNAVNLGVAGNLEAAVAASSGAIIVQAAADDIAEPQRVARLMAAFADPSVAIVASGHTAIDRSGAVLAQQPAADALTYDFSLLFRHPNAIGGATASYRRAVFETFAPMPREVRHEDMVLVFRACLLGRAVVLGERLVRYRQHGASSTGSIGAAAASRAAYIAAARRHAVSLWIARRQQFDDLALAQSKGMVDDAAAAAARAAMAPEFAAFALARSLILRDQPLPVTLMAAKRAGVAPKQIIRLLAMNRFPSLWYSWLRLRERLRR